MSTLQKPEATKSRLQPGNTKGLQAGPSRRSKPMGRTTNRRTQGNTTTGTTKVKDHGIIEIEGVQVNVTPKPLMMSRADKEEAHHPGAGQHGQDVSQQGSQLASQQSQDNSQAEKDSKDKKEDKKEEKKDDSKAEKKAESESDVMGTSSVFNTSQDETTVVKEDKKKEKFTEAELDAEVVIELRETETQTLFFKPGVIVIHDSEENEQASKVNKEYDALKQNKIGSDSYMVRSAQTMITSQKTKLENFQGYTQENKESYASTFEIFDASKQVHTSESVAQEAAFLKSIDDIMSEKLKKPNVLFDAEASLADHISIISSQVDKSADGRSRSRVSNSSKSRSKRMKSSKSNIGESKGEQSDTSSVSGSMAGTGTNQPSTTGVGDFKTVKAKDVQYIEEELPETMAGCFQIITRLLTQSKYHEKQVLYKNYPPVDIVRAVAEDENKDADGGGMGMMFGKQEKKEEEKKEEEDADADKDDDDTVKLIHLFTFQCDLTAGRQVTCIDINQANPDLIAVSYGEFDIDCPAQPKNGILAFWTLKNPTFPEKYITHEYSITCCQFSKKDPYLIAVGDCIGNILVYNIRSEDYTTPVNESTDLDGKHTDIIWEIRWVDKDPKPEALVSVSGDGRIIEWSRKKGFEKNDLTQLKRDTNPNQQEVFASAAVNSKDQKGDMIFINTGGMSIDFPVGQSGMQYYAATEDCAIHKCSTSNPDMYMQSYYGHQGPIYRVRCNPFWNGIECPIFLTCSYDWTVRVWNANSNAGGLVCQQVSGSDAEKTIRDQVNDIEWSPDTSTCFASVANDGRIEIWDLWKDNLSPLVTYFDKDEEGNNIKIPKTTVKFSVAFEKNPFIVTGNQMGQIDIYRAKGLDHIPVLPSDQRARLVQALQKDDFSTSNTNKDGEE